MAFRAICSSGKNYPPKQLMNTKDKINNNRMGKNNNIEINNNIDNMNMINNEYGMGRDR